MSPYSIKICIFGDPGVGKTSLIRQFTIDEFCAEYKETLGADFVGHTFEPGDLKEGYENDSVYLNIYDIAGHFNTFCPMFQMYTNGLHGYFLAFAIDDQNSLEHLNRWYDFIITNSQSGSELPFVLVGCKNDLEKSINEEQLSQIEEKFGKETLYTSSLEDQGVDEAFKKLTWEILER